MKKGRERERWGERRRERRGMKERERENEKRTTLTWASGEIFY